LIKYVSILIPELGPFGEIFLEARERAMVAAFLVNKPLGGCVESVVTLETQRLADGALERDLVADVDFFFPGERAGIATSRGN
jgi:hypothetical protein